MRRPLLILTVDPDSRRTAYAVAVWDGKRYVYRGSWGGGTSKQPVEWQTITGQLALMREVAEREGVEFARVRVVIETQGAKGERSRDVEELRRVRYHWQAACELLGCVCKFVSIAWADHFVPGAKRLGKGAQKKAYMRKAQAMTNGETDNEDRCAAFGILAVEIAAKKSELCILERLT